MKFVYSDNAFFTNWREGGGDRESITAIKRSSEDPGVPPQQVEEKRILTNGDVNPEYEEIIKQLSNEKILSNTKLRKHQKEKKERDANLLKEEKKQSRLLEELFASKLQVFEIEEVKNSSNRKLRSLIRRAKNAPELYAYTTLLLGIEKGIINDESSEN